MELCGRPCLWPSRSDERQGLAAPPRERADRSAGEAPASYIDAMLRGIVGFHFAITRLEGKWKMSQNRDANDCDGVAKGLGQRDDGDDLEMAVIVLRHTKPSS